MHYETDKNYALIDLDNLRSNYEYARELVGGKTKVMAVIKADAYGHGAAAVAGALAADGADRFAVANIDEAILLRENGIEGMILVLGYTLPKNFPLLHGYSLSQCVMSPEYLSEISDYAESAGKDIKIHIKLNTGMNRIGFQTDDDPDFQRNMEYIAGVLANSPHLVREGIFTHFSTADEGDNDFVKLQFLRFMNAVSVLASKGVTFAVRHACNTAASFLFPEMRLDMVRFGIGLYGYGLPEMKKYLRPVMSFFSSVISVSSIEAGESIGYGRTYKAASGMRTATIAVGYADGLKRCLSGRGNVIIRGRRVPIIGRICMDMAMVDITGMDDVSVGDTVTIFGYDRDGGACIPTDEVAAVADTISYEMLCAVGNRVTRIVK